MLVHAWEAHATAAAQSGHADSLWSCVCDTITFEAISPQDKFPASQEEDKNSLNICVFIGMDTRPSSAHLAECAALGVRLTGVRSSHLGLCTTPMLHFAVWEQRDGSFDRYFSTLAQGFQALTVGAVRACQQEHGLLQLSISCTLTHGRSWQLGLQSKRGSLYQKSLFVQDVSSRHRPLAS
jgi:CDP-diacylglycerol pyrophosphatase